VRLVQAEFFKVLQTSFVTWCQRKRPGRPLAEKKLRRTEVRPLDCTSPVHRVLRDLGGKKTTKDEAKQDDEEEHEQDQKVKEQQHQPEQRQLTTTTTSAGHGCLRKRQ